MSGHIGFKPAPSTLKETVAKGLFNKLEIVISTIIYTSNNPFRGFVTLLSRD